MHRFPIPSRIIYWILRAFRFVAKIIRILHPFPEDKLMQSFSTNTTINSELYKYRWYTNLLLLQYLLASSLVAYALSVFPGSGNVSTISTREVALSWALTFLAHGTLSIFIMWLATALFLNEEVCQFCITIGLDKCLPRHSVISAFLWCVPISGLVTAYVYIIFFVLGNYSFD